jgi:hypothetical protein
LRSEGERVVKSKKKTQKRANSDWKAYIYIYIYISVVSLVVVVAARGKDRSFLVETKKGAKKPPEISSGILELLLWVVVPGERMKMTGVLDLGSAFLTASKFLPRH